MIDDRFLPRVWTDKGYYYPIFSELGITYENKNLPFTKENLKDINWAFRWRFNHSNENVDMEYINTLEQCTGLKDKNGKLIYEGDICRIKGTYYDCDYKEYIEVDDIEKVESLEKFFGEAMLKSVYSALGCDTLQVEVIGNIHENADLLENGK